MRLFHHLLRLIWRWVIGGRFCDTVARHEAAADRLDAAVREVLKR
ncbi:hypothetical protein [Ovoidimarina sediminis]|nr:hypothetical protein [Rhodophyticola sp. MJ-SS7]MDU8942253.1 hypothetical protein [Rhodophyticola sp. MJ-SS7]